MLEDVSDAAFRFRDAVDRITHGDEGAGIVEYVLLILFIALIMILALGLFSGALGDAFGRAGDSFPT